MLNVGNILVTLAPVVLIGFFFWFTYYTIMDALKLKGDAKLMWILVILLLFPFGSIIYAIVSPRKKR